MVIFAIGANISKCSIEPGEDEADCVGLLDLSKITERYVGVASVVVG